MASNMQDALGDASYMLALAARRVHGLPIATMLVSFGRRIFSSGVERLVKVNLASTVGLQLNPKPLRLQLL